jgi:tetratricopeptide (TPR) repeat protein
MTRRFVLPLLFVLTLFFSLLSLGEDAKPATKNPDLVAADQLYKESKFAEAADKYQAVINAEPNLVGAQYGLIRALLRQQKVDEAFTAANRFLTAQPNSSVLLAGMGAVQYRQGQMSDAETSYLKSVRIDDHQIPAYLGLMRIYRAYSLYGHAYAELKKAHEIAPNDSEVQRLWFTQLPRQDRIAALEDFLANPHAEDPEQLKSMRQYLAFLKATADRPAHACRLVSKVEQTDTKLEVLRRDPQHMVGVGLTVKLNNHDTRLEVDTGASGIVVGRKAAEKAGLERIAEASFAGIGDKGTQTGYIAAASRIKVGELEFEDCLVQVSDRASITNEDGLIGADVFSSYLIDIDIPDLKLRLSPLPKRPDQATAPTSLKTEEDSQSGAEEESEPASDQKQEAASTASKPAAPAVRIPQDRYIAPDMEKWTTVFRFGHTLLIRTRVNDSPPMLFMIDTGSNMNTLSTKEARQVAKVSSDPNVRVKGLSGEVSKVYSANKAMIVFGHLAQKNQDIVTFDLSDMSRHFGTELSGILGFQTLHMLQIKIDYRDGLVDFGYDIKRFGEGTK